MEVFRQLKNSPSLRIYSFLTSLVLSLSILFSILGVIGGILIQTIVSSTIILGSSLELLQILIVLQLVDRKNRVGWILHRFSYVTLLVMIFSFLSIIGSSYITSFYFLGKDIMIVAVIGYIMQASFGTCLSSITYHLLLIDEVWGEAL